MLEAQAENLSNFLSEISSCLRRSGTTHDEGTHDEAAPQKMSGIIDNDSAKRGVGVDENKKTSI